MKQKLNREQLLAKVERYTEIPMLVLVIVMIVALVIPLVIPLSPELELTLEWADWIIWSLFALELIVKTYLSGNRISYLKKNWMDVILVAVPLLRVFRIFRIARLARGARLVRSTRAIRALRFVRIIGFFGKFTGEVKRIFSKNGFHYLFLVFVVFMSIGTALVYHFDQGLVDGADSVDKSLWLAVVNSFSGGFANIYPSSVEAKVISVVLMVIGTILVSFFTASLASYFTEKEQDIEQEEIKHKLDAIAKEISELKKNI